MTNITYRVIYWGHNEAFPVNQLNMALCAVYNGENAPSATGVPTTDSDNSAIVVSSHPLTPEQAQERWANFAKE